MYNTANEWMKVDSHFHELSSCSGGRLRCGKKYKIKLFIQFKEKKRTKYFSLSFLYVTGTICFFGFFFLVLFMLLLYLYSTTNAPVGTFWSKVLMGLLDLWIIQFKWLSRFCLSLKQNSWNHIYTDDKRILYMGNSLVVLQISWILKHKLHCGVFVLSSFIKFHINNYLKLLAVNYDMCRRRSRSLVAYYTFVTVWKVLFTRHVL